MEESRLFPLFLISNFSHYCDLYWTRSISLRKNVFGSWLEVAIHHGGEDLMAEAALSRHALQLPLTPVPEELTTSPDLCTHLHIHGIHRE